jgi:hypothetical protein
MAKGKSRNSRSASSLSRKSGRKLPRKNILIVCEGETETFYFKALKIHLRLPRTVAVKVENKKKDSAPIKVVNFAIELIRKQKIAAKCSNFSLPYDESWCLIDVENTAQNSLFNKAVNIADDRNVKLAVSNPAIEYWFLLHFEYSSRPFADGQEIKRYLKKHVPNYKEGQNIFPDLLPNLDIAINRAEKRLDNNLSDARYPNPSTLVPCLVSYLREIQKNPKKPEDAKLSAICEKKLR